MALTEEIAAHLSKITTAPYLFIGAGLSRRYLGIESWEDLLKKYASETGHEYNYYRATAASNFPAIGSAIAEAFHEVWWSGKKYKTSREGASNLIDKSSAIKFEISKYLRGASDNVTTGQPLIDEISLLQAATIDGIITTNWDLHLEKLFPSFKPFIGQDELLFQNPAGIGEIYKIHGCCSQPNSLILTKEDYERYNAKNPYLVAKLLSVFIEHPVIFLGYSLQDPNIRSILRSISYCLSTEHIKSLQDRLIFVEYNQTSPTNSLIPSNIAFDDVTIPIYQTSIANFNEVFAALGTIKRKIPVRLLRLLKEQVVELVKTNDPKGKIIVRDLDKINAGDAPDFAIGIGAISGKSYDGSITRQDLLDDSLMGTGNYDPRQIVEKILPALAKTNAYIPVCKYLREAGFLSDKNKDLFENLADGIKQRANRKYDDFCNKSYKNSRAAVNSKYKSLADLLDREKDPRQVLIQIQLLDQNKIDNGLLRKFLSNNRTWKTFEQTQHSKLICLLDWLEYGIS